jgi:hypothetical protein
VSGEEGEERRLGLMLICKNILTLPDALASRVRIHLSKFVISRLKTNSHPIMVTSRALLSHHTNYKSQWIVFRNANPPGFENASTNSTKSMQLSDLLQYIIFFIHPFRIHVSLSYDRLSWHSSQEFANESANIIRSVLFSVVALHFSRLCG